MREAGERAEKYFARSLDFLALLKYTINMNSNKHNAKGTELASQTFESYMFGDRTIAAYLMANGEYRVRLYLPAGELVPYEKVYAYRGRDIEAARAAWKATVAEWSAMAANYR